MREEGRGEGGMSPDFLLDQTTTMAAGCSPLPLYKFVI